MARTDSSSVQGVLLQDYDSDNAPSLTPFIALATAIVDRVDTCATNKGITLSDTELELIERWLAAHFYAQSDRTLLAEKQLNASATYNGKTGMGLEASSYGQSAMLADYSGCLQAINARRQARGWWLGKPVSQEIPLEDRD